MKLIRRIAAAAAAIAMLTGLSACGMNSEFQERKDQQERVTLKDSLGLRAQQERLKREEDANTVRYVYLMSFGQIVGYYVIKGGVYPAGTQLAPENDIVQPLTGGDRYVVDSAKDNGTYNSGADDGVFFFTSDGTLVETDLNYIQSDNPLPIDTPRLGGEKK